MAPSENFFLTAVPYSGTFKSSKLRKHKKAKGKGFCVFVAIPIGLEVNYAQPKEGGHFEGSASGGFLGNGEGWRPREGRMISHQLPIARYQSLLKHSVLKSFL